METHEGMLDFLADLNVHAIQLLQLFVCGGGAGAGVDEGADVRLELDDLLADGVRSCLLDVSV